MCEAEKHALRLRIVVRSALAGQVGQEQLGSRGLIACAARSNNALAPVHAA